MIDLEMLPINMLTQQIIDKFISQLIKKNLKFMGKS
jgi:hypothetical protein